MVHRKLLFGITSWLLISGPAHSDSLIPLQEYLQSTPPSDQTSVYVLYRCTALFTLLTSLIKDEAQNQLIVPKLNQFWSLTIRFHAKLRDGGTHEEITKQVMDAVDKIGVKYLKATNENYIGKGHYITGSALLEGDLDVCAEVQKQLDEN